MSGHQGCFPPPAFLTEEDVTQLLKDSLKLKVSTTTDEASAGSNGICIQLVFNDTVLSEVSV